MTSISSSPARHRTAAVSIGIVFGGTVLMGAMLLLVAAVKAATYTGIGDSGVFDLLTWGRAIFALGLVALILLVAVRAGIRQYRA